MVPVAVDQAMTRQMRAASLTVRQSEREQHGHEEGEEGCSDGRHWHGTGVGAVRRGV
jgi:hypothetical protein